MGNTKTNTIVNCDIDTNKERRFELGDKFCRISEMKLNKSCDLFLLSGGGISNHEVKYSLVNITTGKIAIKKNYQEIERYINDYMILVKKITISVEEIQS